MQKNIGQPKNKAPGANEGRPSHTRIYSRLYFGKFKWNS